MERGVRGRASHEEDSVYLQIVVPTDGGPTTLEAFGPAKRLAAVCDAPVVVLTVIGTDEDAAHVRATIVGHLPGFDPARDRIEIVHGTAPADAVLAELERVPGSLLCMRSRGHAHTDPLLGVVTEAVLRGTTGPAVLIGPHVATEAWSLRSPMVVCTDGSVTAHTIVPLAAQWGIAMGVDLTVCAVSEPSTSLLDGRDEAGDMSDAALPAHMADELRDAIGRPVDFDALHGDDVARTIVRYAEDRDAGLIAVATHGRTGLKRLALGSTTMAILHHSKVPVLTQRPPTFAQE